jgi:hypothetical protein
MKIRLTSLVKLFIFSLISSGITYLLMVTGAFGSAWKYIFFSIGLFVLIGLDISRDHQIRVLKQHLLEMKLEAEREAFENSREEKLKKQHREGGYNYWNKWEDQ